MPLNTKLLTILFLCIGISALAANANPDKHSEYPVPPQTDKLMFYIQRSMNTNTIAYELNVDKNNQLDQDHPIHPYWIRYEEDGSRKELSYIERKFAYGIKDVANHDEDLALSLVSFPLELELRKVANASYKMVTTVNAREIEMNHIYFKTEGGTFWEPVVKYIDIFGIDLKSGLKVVERIIP